jgi:integrase
MLTGRRLLDLCQLRSDQLTGEVLTILPVQDKTHRELAFPLPPDLAATLHQIKGPVYLWERYATESRTYNPGPANVRTFAPATMYNAVKSIFKKYNDANPTARVKTHDLRKRAITVLALATQNVDQTADALGIDPQTARKHYLDASKAFDTAALLKKMSGVLLPPLETK